MRILVSDTLKKDIEKLFHSENILSIFLAKISKVNPEKIYLKRPYVKIKITIFSYTLRVIARYIPENSLLIPLFILEKKNKRFGENIMWNKISKEKIFDRNDKINTDIENSNFYIYSKKYENR